MSNPKRYYWMKLKESFMTSDTIDYFMSQPDGANYVVLYQMLCLKTINTDGRLSRQIGEIIIPYDVEKIQRDCKWFSADTIRVALNLYKMAGLIYEDVDGTLVLSDHRNLVGSESDSAARVRKHRDAQAALQCNTHVTENVTPEIDTREQILELDTRDKENGESTADKPPAPPRPAIPYERIKDMYNELCPSLHRCTKLSEARKKAIKARISSGYTLEDFERLFRKAEASSFLRGKNRQNWVASFDFLVRDEKMARTLDGEYDDNNGGGHSNGTAPSGAETPKYGTWL